MSGFFRHANLRVALALAALAGVVLPALFSLIALTYLAQQESERDLKVSVKQLASSYASALWFFSDDWVDEVTRKILSDHSVAGVKIVRNNQTLVREITKPDIAGQALVSYSTPIYYAHLSLAATLEAPALAESQEMLGTLTLTYFVSGLREGYQSHLYAIAWIVLLQALAASALLVLVLYFKIGRKVQRLLHAADDLKLGRLHEPYHWDDKDEFGKIGRAFESAREAIADYVVELHAANKQLAELSSTDQLTNLYNRLKLNEIFNYELCQTNRYQSGFSIILLDLDHFKLVNDTHGHQAGDAVLQAFALVLREHVRASDSVGRWGGEEFLILCPQAALDSAVQLALKLQAEIAAYDFPFVGSMTASLGVSTYQAGDNQETMVDRADRALYESKYRGRNRVTAGDIDGKMLPCESTMDFAAVSAEEDLPLTATPALA
jgi:diguanylate cyclase (GGDEF)-like protein